MVDFHAVIEKAVDGLSDNSPELRAKVYDRARAAIKRQLDNISPPLSDAIKNKQLSKLEEAIGDIEGQMALSMPDLEEEVFADLVSDDTDELFEEEEYEPAPPPRRAPPRPERRRPEPARRPEQQHDEPRYDEPRYDEPRYDEPRYEEPRYEDDFDAGDEEDFDSAYQEPALDDEFEPGDDLPPLRRQARVDDFEPDDDRSPPRRQARGDGFEPGNDRQPSRRPGRDDGFEDWGEPDNLRDERGRPQPVAPRRRGRKSSGRPLVAILAIIVVLAVIVFGAWFFFRGPIMQVADIFLSSGGTERMVDTSPASSGDGTGRQSQNQQTRSAGASPDGKYTQRLMPDGTEIDAGPAGGGQHQSVEEEGKSTAMLSEEPSTMTPESGNASGTGMAPGTGAAPNSASEAPQVSQKMILYEERTDGQGTTGEAGTVVWSVVRESPGDGQPPEPAIQAKVNVPSKGLNALITIKRNGDPSLPASHLIEVVFAFSENFQGGGIKSVQSPALKAKEQDRGDTLIAVPAKITDTFFMVALNDYSEAADVNLRLLKERNWIDFPIAYGNDQRAVIALEKGATGTEVFDQVIRAWEARKTSDSQ